MTTIACPQCAVPDAIPDDHVCQPCSRCNSLMFRPSGGPLIVVAYENPELRRSIGEGLWTAGFNVIATTGQHVTAILAQHPPAAIALDVGLAVISPHEVIQLIKEDATLQATKIVLVASVYNKAAYKRRPSKLYGADDYIDQHQVDALPRKMSVMLNFTPGTSTVNRGTDSEGLPDLSSRLRVRALAQSIVADIALYHNAEVERAIRTGTVENLRGALDEGRRLLAEMAQVQELQDPIGTAFSAFINDMRRVEK